MKFAFCSEDRSDDEILRAFAERVLGESIEALPTNLLLGRSGGWQDALKLAPFIAKAIFPTEAHGAVFVIDNDGAPLHEPGHEQEPSAACRLCALRLAAAVREVASWPRPQLPPLQFVFAVPVQVLETWLLLADRRFPHNKQPHAFGTTGQERRELKRILYGDERATRDQRLAIGLPIARSFDVAATSALSASLADFGQQLRVASDAVRGATGN
ncbi:MAG: hypothetical protein Q8N23_18635 [Archangium sp.]|nr:hypothetical protein [Archangium sp.]MDP3573592.1 hypothetical protein [Archangium sp.]